jgi:hypothetical protein
MDMEDKMHKIYVLKKRPYLDAIDKLLKYYKAVVDGKKPEDIRCPFCKIVESLTHSGGCLLNNWACPWHWFAQSPWHWFTQTDCDNFAIKQFDGTAAFCRSSQNLSWAKLRIKMLTKWKKELV